MYYFICIGLCIPGTTIYWADETLCIDSRFFLPSTHHSSLLDAVARLDDGVLLSRSAQEVWQLAVGTMHSLTLCSVCTVTTFMLQWEGHQRCQKRKEQQKNIKHIIHQSQSLSESICGAQQGF